MRRAFAALPFVGLALLATFLFRDALFGQGTFFSRDIHWVWYAHVETMVRAVAERAWPLWDPHLAFGSPTLADPSYQLAYPPTWFNLILPPAVYYKAFVVGHALLAGIGLLRLARRLGLSPLPAFVAAAIWMTSGPFLALYSLYHHYAGLAWMPWVLAALERALERQDNASALLLGGTAAVQVLAGSGDVCLMTAVAVLARLTVFAFAAGAARLLVAVRIGGVASLAALLLSAVQWLPTAANFHLGSRLHLSDWARTYWSLHPASLIDIVVPGLVSDSPLAETVRASLFEWREPFLERIHLGIGAMALATIGVVAGRQSKVALWWSLGVVFTFLALGRHAPGYLVLSRLPPFSLLRYPVKYMAAASVCAAVLAGMGTEIWLRSWARRERVVGSLVLAGLTASALALAGLAVWTHGNPGYFRTWVDADQLVPSIRRLWIASGFAAAMAIALAGRLCRARGGRWLTAIVVLLVLGELTFADREVIHLASPQLTAFRPSWILRIAKEPPVRIYVRQPAPSDRAKTMPPPPGWTLDWWRTLSWQEMLTPPIGGRWGLDGSYDGDFTGLAPRELGDLSLMIVQRWGTPQVLRLLQMGSVDYVVALDEEPWLGAPDVVHPSTFRQPIRAYPVPQRLPRAYLVDGVRSVDESRALAAILDPSFDPSHEVVLNGVGFRPPNPEFLGSAHLVFRRADALSIEVVTNAAGYLVLTEAFHPGWRAEVDGQPTNVLKANALFRAVAVPQGRHHVSLCYRPAAVLWGAMISGVAGLVGLVLTGVRLPLRRGESRARRNQRQRQSSVDGGGHE